MKLIRLSVASSPLGVAPVRRYADPKYPSFADPDPTRFPERVPFPFGRELAAALATATLGCMPDASAVPTPARERPASAGQTVAPKPSAPMPPPAENPFLLSKSGLPHRTSPYGTGAPSHVADDLARRVIERVFEESGLHLESGAYDENGVAFKIDGYDEKARIGFVWASHENLDGDAVIGWMRERELDPQRGQQPPEGEPVEVTLQKRWSRMISNAKGTTPADRERLVRKYVTSPFDPASNELYLREAELRDQLVAIEARAEAKSKDKLAYWEALQLERLAATKQAFIAVISTYDRRFEYGGDAWTPEQRARLEAVGKLGDVKAQQEAYRQLHEELAKDAVQRLEDEARRYVAWARSQAL